MPAAQLVKVPQVTLIFWVIKVLTTGMGETTSDYLVHTLGPVIAVPLGALAFAATLVIQFRASRYLPAVYWSAVVMVSVFGTMAADVLHVGLGVPYLVSTTFFVVGLAAVFLTWYRVEGTLSMHSIATPRREAFYWAAVLGTFALGTALSDFTAVTVHLGWLTSALLFTLAIGMPVAARLLFGLNAIAAFWIAYVLTRPLGASYADWLGLPVARHGVGFGTGPISAVLFAAILVAVGSLILRPRTPQAPSTR